MQMRHHFTAPAPIDVVWNALLDPERVARCMPGATLNQAEGDEVAGSVSVTLGPISLLYEGTGTFSTVDSEARRMVINASGEDARGNGMAAASVAAVLTEQAGSERPSTSVRVDTDLKLTGKPAQLGSGLISEIGGEILDQFARCFSERLTGAAESTAGAETGDAETGDAEPGDAETGGAETRGAETRGAATGGERAAGEPDGQSGADASVAAGANGQRAPRNGGSSGASAAPVGKAPGWRITPAPTGGADAARGAATISGDQSTDGAIDLLDTPRTPVLKRVVPVLIALAAVALAAIAKRRKRRR